jgi:hypothetical protein
MKKNLLLFFVVFLISCTLDRNNPADPFYSGIQAPTEVQNIQVRRVNDTTSEITWDIHEDEDVVGYYIYRSLYYNGSFEFLKERAYEDTSYTDSAEIILYDYPIRWGYYKMSAYKIVNGHILEGRRSTIKYHGDDSD